MNNLPIDLSIQGKTEIFDEWLLSLPLADQIRAQAYVKNASEVPGIGDLTAKELAVTVIEYCTRKTQKENK